MSLDVINNNPLFDCEGFETIQADDPLRSLSGNTWRYRQPGRYTEKLLPNAPIMQIEQKMGAAEFLPLCGYFLSFGSVAELTCRGDGVTALAVP